MIPNGIQQKQNDKKHHEETEKTTSLHVRPINKMAKVTDFELLL